MVNPIKIIRVNANDDYVKLNRVLVSQGDFVSSGDIVAEIETQKTVVEIETNESGYILRIDLGEGTRVEVGDTLLWIGSSKREKVPEEKPDKNNLELDTGDLSKIISLKAKKVLQHHGLSISDIPFTGEKITISDIEKYLSSKNISNSSIRPSENLPTVEHISQELSEHEIAMKNMVQWHKIYAVPAYLEICYDYSKWVSYANKFRLDQELITDPSLSLLIYSLIKTVKKFPIANSIISSNKKLIYSKVNIGSTVVTPKGLFLLVIPDAENMDKIELYKKLLYLQKQAYKDNLSIENTTGCTIGFTSLSNTRVLRHMPVLPANTSVIISHSRQNDSGEAIMGITYDHRLIDGNTAHNILQSVVSLANMNC